MAATLPARAWETITLREGATGPLAFQFARQRVWSVRHRRAGPPLGLLMCRSLGRVPEVKSYLSHGEPEVPLRPMAQVTGVRGRVEEFFEDANGQRGMAPYEARSWTNWHHPMSPVAWAHLLVTPTRRDRKGKKGKRPERTVDMALVLLRCALPRPRLSLEDAEALIAYHQARNRQAIKSHRQRWLAKHLKPVPRK